MKKNLSFILVLVMLISSLLSVAPMAEEVAPATENASTGMYIPEITYTNLTYAEKMCMMFAVPAPTALEDGTSVKLVVWDSRESSLTFSYNDIMKEVLAPESETVNINGIDHLVFNYDKITPYDMTKNICARPVIIKDGVATLYGELIDYSVLEYVVAAKGEFEGIAGIEDPDFLQLLDDLLDLGALAQKFSSKREPDFYANDDVNKIFVVPVINGIVKDKVFSGFFKYTEGADITLTTPFYDGTNVIAVKDAEGNALEDLDSDIKGYQIKAADGDITLTVEYRNVSIRTLNADLLGPDVDASNYGEVTGGYDGMVSRYGTHNVTLGKDVKTNLSGAACTEDKYGRMNYWHGFRTVEDPENPNGLVLMVSATNVPAMFFYDTTPTNWQGVGFGDTIYPAFTFEITLGAVNGRMPNAGKYYFRHRQEVPGVDEKGYTNLFIFQIKNGELTLADGTKVGKIPETGMIKFAITVDALTNEVFGYCENENGEMICTAQSTLTLDKTWLGRQKAHLANLADDDPTNDEMLISYESVFNFFTKSTLEPTWDLGEGPKVNEKFEKAEIEINGVMTKIKREDETFNMEAVQALAERDYSFLVDDFKLTLGYLYK